MRTISAAEDALLTAVGGRSVRFRVKVKDSGGTFRDLTTYGPYNMCVSADWRETTDSPGLEANVVLKREVEKWSLAPLMAASAFNLALAYPGSYAKLVDVARELQIDVAVVPDGITPASGDWVLAFHGYIDEVDPADGEHLVLRCSDLQAKLRDTYIERERSYAHAQGANATKGCVVWRGGDTLAVGERGIPSQANRNGHFYRITAITTGITGSAEPIWPTVGGSTVVDGGVTWTESGSTSITAGTLVETVMQQIIDDNLGAGVFTLSVPVSPAWAIKAYKQDRGTIWAALVALSDQIGWDLRFRWDSGSSSFKLTLLKPDRAKTTADRAFTPSRRYPLRRMPLQVQWIRNVIRVWYSDSADLDAEKRPKRKKYEATDAASIAAYGRRFMEIAEAATANIDTTAEATALANACRDDLALPVTDHEAEVPFFRFVELFDLYQWNADGIHYDSDQKLATVGYSHAVSGGSSPKARTTISCRGKPSAGMKHWLEKGAGETHAQDLVTADSVSLDVTNIVGGSQIRLAGNQFKEGLMPEFELHVSPTSGFTPDSTTLVASGMGAVEATIADLVPGEIYYALAIPFGHNRSRLVRGEPSAEHSFVAGRGSAGHLHPYVEWGRMPLNGGFETWLSGAVPVLPDHWANVGGWTTGLERHTGDDTVSGEDCVRFFEVPMGDAEPAIISALFPVESAPGVETVYELSWFVNLRVAGTATGGDLHLYINWYKNDGTFISKAEVDSAFYDGNTSTGDHLDEGFWYRRSGTQQAPPDARFGAVSIEMETPFDGGLVFDVDSVRFERA